MNLYVCGINEVPAYIEGRQITHCLTLINNEHLYRVEEAVTNFNVIWHTVHVADVEWDQKDAPNEDHVKSILDWFDTIPDNANVLIHCHAGISRSTCAALALLVKKNGNDEWSIKNARNELVKIRSIAHPNLRFAHLYDKALDCNGEFVKAVKYIRGTGTGTFGNIVF